MVDIANINKCGCRRCYALRVSIARFGDLRRSLEDKNLSDDISKRSHEARQAHRNYLFILGEWRDPITMEMDCLHPAQQRTMDRVFILVTLADIDPMSLRVFSSEEDAHQSGEADHGPDSCGYKYVVIPKDVGAR